MAKTKGTYVDGYVLAVPKKNLAFYRKIATLAGKTWIKYGALEYRECVGDDLAVKGLMPFTKAVKAKPGETVFFSYIVFKSRAHRDQVNKKVMKDPAMNEPSFKKGDEPFDMKRMAYGGFKVIVNE